MKAHLINGLKGLVIGASMLIPGVSGGTMAIILNIYDKLLTAVSHFFRDVKKHLILLLTFAAGGLLGVFLFSRIILQLTNQFHFPMLSFFMGAILGGLPALIHNAKQDGKLYPHQALYVLLGIAIVACMYFRPDNLFAVDSSNMPAYILTLLFAGILCAIALILPGISISYMLLVFDLYEPTMTAISTLDFSFLIPMGIGMLGGTLLMIKVLEKAMVDFPQISYPIIIGFLLGSLPEVFPGIPSGINWLLCPLMLAAGFAAICFLSHLSGETTE
ncbi:MAG: DUF368 domain-containing protein [Candidatus Merdivicinus sp.]|jgi:putative membrane protein